MKAVTFDFGQTLAELDYHFLTQRVAERGAKLDPVASRKGSADAWHLYGIKKGEGHAAAWRAMMQAHLVSGGVSPEATDELSAWLWSEQPRRNLWRKPIAGMIELVRALRKASVPVGIISNSEGHLAELVAELGWSSDFDVIVDSGRLGIDKPEPGIFRHACAALSVTEGELLHIGDAWEADVNGALQAGARAVWFDPGHRQRELPARVEGAGDPAELREVLARLSLLS